jgi:hypothetical protein
LDERVGCPLLILTQLDLWLRRLAQMQQCRDDAFCVSINPRLQSGWPSALWENLFASGVATASPCISENLLTVIAAPKEI